MAKPVKAKKKTPSKEEHKKSSDEITLDPKYVVIGIGIIIILIAAFFLVPPLLKGQKAESGDTVDIRYAGMLDDGTVFDTNIPDVARKNNLTVIDKPLTFTLGDGRVIPGFDKAIVGMKEGQEKRVEIQPADAYGTYDASKQISVPLVREVPRTREVVRNVIIPLAEFSKVFNTTPVQGALYTVPQIPWGHRVLNVTDNNVHLYIEPELGTTYTLPNSDFKATVVGLNESTVTFRQDPSKGQIVQTNLGPTEVVAKGDVLVLTAKPSVGDSITTQSGPAVVKSVSKENAMIDFNHRLAGKTLIFQIKLEKLTKKAK